MKNDAENRAFVRKFINTVRECMEDHNITMGELATLTGRSPHKLRLQFINGNLDLEVCAALRFKTGDMRALGLPADHKLSGTLDEAVMLATVTR